MTGSSRESLPDVRLVVWTYKMPGSGGEALPDVQRPSRMFSSGREALPDVREWSEGHHGCPGEVKWPSQMSGSVR